MWSQGLTNFTYTDAWTASISKTKQWALPEEIILFNLLPAYIISYSITAVQHSSATGIIGTSHESNDPSVKLASARLSNPKQQQKLFASSSPAGTVHPATLLSIVINAHRTMRLKIRLLSLFSRNNSSKLINQPCPWNSTGFCVQKVRNKHHFCI